MDYPCPNCGFPGAAILPDGSRKCASCGHTWYFRMEYPHPPAAAVALPVSGGSGRLVLAGVGAIILLSIGLAVFLSAGGSGASQQPAPDLPGPEVAPVTREPEHSEDSGRLSAELGPERVSGHNGISPWWLVEYRNIGEAAIGFPTIKAHVKDEQDRPVLDRETVASVYRLPPGQSLWVLVSVPGNYKGSYRAEFEIVGPKRADRYTPKQTRLEVIGHELQPNPSPSLKKFPFLAGKVRNDGEVRLSSVRVHAVGYNADDKPCAFTQGYARVTNLQAGQESDFKLGTGTWQTETPIRWQIEAWGTARE